MCGIAGEINYKQKIDLNVINAMSKALTPRGPDADGIFTSPCAALAHRRLIVIDPENGKQPMTDGIYTLIYNGELYNTEDLRAELLKSGVKFRGHSDTEVVLKAFIEYGERCVELFNGIFAFAVWNKKTRRLFLARDRIGVKPLFYAETDGGLVFASEIKALLKHPAVKPVITSDGAAQIMLVGPARIVGDGVFRDIHEIRAAHCAWFDESGIKTRKYWELNADRHLENLDETTYHLRSLIFDSVKRQLVSDVGLCTFLSGGLDSSIISAIAAHEFAREGKTLDTYSIDYRGNRENFKASAFQPDEDAPYVAEMAEFLHTNHHNIILDTPALTEALDDAAFARDLPGMADVDSSLWLFCREIKKDYSVALSGECADEYAHTCWHPPNLFCTKHIYYYNHIQNSTRSRHDK